MFYNGYERVRGCRVQNGYTEGIGRADTNARKSVCRGPDKKFYELQAQTLQGAELSHAGLGGRQV
jgi:hypothetical protein